MGEVFLMRWNCPHCGIALVVSDDKLTGSWSFSRCVQCDGYALVRRPDLNLIRVNHVPRGQEVIQPEAVAGDKPVIRPSTRQIQKKAPNPVPTMATSPAPAPSPAGQEMLAVGEPVSIPKSILTDSLAELDSPSAAPEQDLTHGTGAISAGPGIPVTSASAPPPFRSAPVILPEPLPEQPELRPFARALPIAISTLGVVALTSGIYLYQQGQRLYRKAQERNPEVAQSQTAAVPQTPTEWTDQLNQRAMAPERTNSETQELPKVATAAVAAIAESSEEAPPSALVVQVKARNASLRAGPGLNYRILGIANSQSNYIVSEWKDQWFKIEIPDGPDQPNWRAIGENDAAPKTAWIRNDLVRLITLD